MMMMRIYVAHQLPISALSSPGGVASSRDIGPWQVIDSNIAIFIIVIFIIIMVIWIISTVIIDIFIIMIVTINIFIVIFTYHHHQKSPCDIGLCQIIIFFIPTIIMVLVIAYQMFTQCKFWDG